MKIFKWKKEKDENCQKQELPKSGGLLQKEHYKSLSEKAKEYYESLSDEEKEFWNDQVRFLRR